MAKLVKETLLQVWVALLMVRLESTLTVATETRSETSFSGGAVWDTFEAACLQFFFSRVLILVSNLALPDS